LTAHPLQTCGWRAESYDTFAQVAKARDDNQSNERLKAKGDEVFENEMAMFGKLRDAMGLQD